MDTKAAVIEMVNAIETLALFSNGLQAHGHGAVLVNARAACNYILSVESQIAERDAEIVRLERKFDCGHRFYDWVTPDESCAACAMKEFFDRADERAEELYAEIRERDAQIAELRKELEKCREVTGYRGGRP